VVEQSLRDARYPSLRTRDGCNYRVRWLTLALFVLFAGLISPEPSRTGASILSLASANISSPFRLDSGTRERAVLLPTLGELQPSEFAAVTVRLTGSVTVPSSTIPATLISASINGRAVAQLTVRCCDEGGNGSLISFGLVSGLREDPVSLGVGTAIRYENYPQVSAVQPGENELQVKMEHLGRGKGYPILELDTDQSGLVLGSAGPYELALSAGPTRPLSPTTIAVPWKLTRQGERPDGPGVVEAELLGRPAWTEAMHYSEVGDGIVGEFSVPVPKQGQSVFVRLRAHNYNAPIALAPYPPAAASALGTSQESGLGAPAFRWAISGLLLLLSLGIYLHHRRRTARSK